MMKILLLSDRLPWPLEQGVNLRIFHFAKHLARHCELDLVTFADHYPQDEFCKIFNRIELFPKPNPVCRQGFFAKAAHYVALDNLHASSAELHKHVTEILRSRQYDVILAYTHVMTYLPKHSHVPVISDVIDDAVLQFWREIKMAHHPRELITKLRYLLMHWRFEHRYFSPDYISTAIITSEVDADMLRRVCPHTSIQVIENGVDTQYFESKSQPELADTLVFEGNMTHGPNAEGALFFCREILPLIQRQRPNVKLTLVGKHPGPDLLALRANPAIDVTGFVDDVRPYLASAAVFICPLLSGGGIKNKLLQAWSMGKACVATSMSTGGLLIKEGENILVRDSAAAFATAVVELLENAEYRTRLGACARNTVVQHYGWAEKSRQLFQLLETASHPTKLVCKAPNRLR